jgi:hypothetical protein
MLTTETLAAAKQEAHALASELYSLYEQLADAGVEAEALGHACDRAVDLSVSLGNESLYAEAPTPTMQAA